MLLVWTVPTILEPVRAEVVAIEIESEEDVLDGRSFGDVGAYRKLSGRVRFAFDPSNAANRSIVDLDRAPRNADGKVEAWGNFMVLAPKDPAQESGTALLEVSNRGSKASLAYFNAARFSLDPTVEDDFGDGLLLRRGLTVIWVGWQFDVPREPGRMRLHVPAAQAEGDDSIQGLVRADWVVDAPTDTLPVAHRNHVAYPVFDPMDPDNRLSVRDGRLEPRREVPRSRWSFARVVDGEPVSSRIHIHMPGGFETGKIYELVYRAETPAIVGLGLAAVRDMISYARYSDDCPFRVEHGIAFGVSQTGRFLRHFLYQGFNVDEGGRTAFDGMLVHTAGAGRGSFNHRFGQPSRDAHRYSAFFYPTDLFPFSGRTQRDPFTGRREGLLDRLRASGHLPRIMVTNTGYEYWGRAASLLHTSLDGSADVGPLPNERIYHLASAQHFTRGFAPRSQDRIPTARGPAESDPEGVSAYRGNPLDLLATERALLVALVAWVRDGIDPPPTTIPRIDDGTLVPIDEIHFPDLPGLPFPKVIHEAYRADYGPRFLTDGIVTKQPPDLGPAYPTLVSQVDRLGNETGGVPSVEILVPVATYAPWCLRIGVPGGVGELADFYGTWCPLARTKSEREATGDPRPSLEELYASKEDYLERARQAARNLVARRFLLEEDIPRVLARAEEQWTWIFANPFPVPEPSADGAAVVEGAVDDGGLPATIVTQVVDARTGEPIEGATMSVHEEHVIPYPTRWPPLRTAASDENGRVRMPIGDLGDRCDWIFFEAEGYGPVATGFTPPDNPIEMEPAVDIPIELRDMLDRPAAGVTVGWVLGCGHTPDLRSVRTDEQGRAVLEGVASGRGELWPSGPGVLSDYVDLPDWREGDPPVLIRCQPGRTIVGRIGGRSGELAAGVAVGAPAAHRGPWTRADRNGRFTLHGVERFTEVSIVPDDADPNMRIPYDWPPHGFVRSIGLPRSDHRPSKSGYEVRIRVLVDAPDGEYVPAFEDEQLFVSAVRDGDGFCRYDCVDADGTVEFRLPRGRYTLIADDGLGPFAQARHRVEIDGPSGGIPIRVGLDPTVSIVLAGLPEAGDVFIADEFGQREITSRVHEGKRVPVPASGPYAFRLAVGRHDRIVKGPEERDGSVKLVWDPREGTDAPRDAGESSTESTKRPDSEAPSGRKKEGSRR